MKFTPLDIKQQAFEKSLRGYDVSEVQAFLSLLSNEWENLLNQNRELEQQVANLKERIKHYERVEEALHETLQTAKESSEHKLTGAKIEASSIIEKAEMKAENIIRDAQQERYNIKQSLIHLADKREEIIGSLADYLQRAQDSLQKYSETKAAIPTLEDIPKVETKTGNNDEKNKLDKKETQKPKAEEDDAIDLGAHAYPPGTDRLDDIIDELD